MAGLNPEFVGRGDKASHVMEIIGDASVDRTSANMGDDGSLMHFPPNWPMPASGLNAAVPTQFTIIFNGSTVVYDGIPAEKVQEIMLIAAAYAKSAEVKIGTQSFFTPLIPTPTSPSSPQGNSNNLPSQQSVYFPPEKSSICRLQGEFPLARRHSLQRFLEKRLVRLRSKGPYASSKKVAGNLENNFFANSPPDLASFKRSKEGFEAKIVAA